MRGMYRELNPDYFDFLAEKSQNPVRRWFHQTRFRTAHSLVEERYKKGMRIVDLGCGSSNWNTSKLAVVGVDSEQEVLQYALKMGRITEALRRDVTRTGLRSNSADIVTMFGVLEHLPGYREALRESFRILKPGGSLIASVPHDTFFSLWQPLFGMHCSVQGTIFGKPYFRKKAGHVNQFSPKRIRQEFEKAGFVVSRQFSLARMEIYTIGTKPA